MANRVIVVGMFSAKHDDHDALMRALEARVVAGGDVVVGRVVQRRGVSRSGKPGGSKRTSAPMSAATYIGPGKAEEVARLRQVTGADLVMIRGTPSATQLARLEAIIGCSVIAIG